VQGHTYVGRRAFTRTHMIHTQHFFSRDPLLDLAIKLEQAALQVQSLPFPHKFHMACTVFFCALFLDALCLWVMYVCVCMCVRGVRMNILFNASFSRTSTTTQALVRPLFVLCCFMLLHFSAVISHDLCLQPWRPWASQYPCLLCFLPSPEPLGKGVSLCVHV